MSDTKSTERGLLAEGRHPVNIGHLVMGVAFAGLAVVWALIAGDVVEGDDIRWLLPAPWVLAGIAGPGRSDHRRPPTGRVPAGRMGRADRGAARGPRHHGGVTTPSLGRITTVPALDRPDLLAPPVAAALAAWPGAAEVGVVEIDPDIADTAAMAAAYDLSMDTGANCVVVAGRRDGAERVAACLVRADTRADVNSLVKRLLDVRKCSFLSMDRAVAESGMEYGGITPVGLPPAWRLLLDARVVDIDVAVIGSGVRRSKLLVPGRLLADLPGAEVVEHLAR